MRLQQAKEVRSIPRALPLHRMRMTTTPACDIEMFECVVASNGEENKLLTEVKEKLGIDYFNEISLSNIKNTELIKNEKNPIITAVLTRK